MMNHLDVVPDYCAKVLELMDTVFNHAVLDLINTSLLHLNEIVRAGAATGVALR